MCISFDAIVAHGHIGVDLTGILGKRMAGLRPEVLL